MIKIGNKIYAQVVQIKMNKINTMKNNKSQPKFRFSSSKYGNYFTQKNWDDPMYMDDKVPQNSDKLNGQLLKSYSSVTIQPRAKLSYSIQDKVDAVLSDSRKMGMIQKVQNPNTRRSIAKISYTSTLPPIKTQVQQTFEYLNKIKNELNQVSLKSIKLSNQISNLRGQTNIIKQKSCALEQILSRKGQKQQKKIDERNQITEQARYCYQVRINMYQNLKHDTRAIAKRKKNYEQKLKDVKKELDSLKIQLDNHMSQINKNIYTKKSFQTKQQLQNQQFYIKSTIAKQKLNHERKAQKLHKKLDQIQSYDKDQYKYETNLQAHFQTLAQLRIQQAFSKMMNCIFQKHQSMYIQQEKSYCLIKMHSLNNKQLKAPNKLTQSVNSTSMVRNSSMVSNNSSINQPELDLLMLYKDSFETKQQLQKSIKQKQKLVQQLSIKKQKLYKEWVQKIFNDSILNGNKVAKKEDNSKQIKRLLQKQQKLERAKLTQTQVLAWIRKQQVKLNVNFSKKLPAGQKILKILEYVQSQVKKIKQIPKYQPVLYKSENKVKKQKNTNKPSSKK